MKFRILLFLSFLITNILFGQNKDSLLQVLQHSKGIDKARVVLNLSSVYQNMERHDSSILLITDFLNDNQNLPATEQIELLSALSKAFYYLSQYEQSVEQLFKAVEIQKKINDTAGLVYNYTRISTIIRKLGKYNDAIEYSSIALKLNEKTGNLLGEAESYSSLGGICYYMNDYPQAIKYFKLALEIFEKLGHTQRIAALNNNIGSVYNETGQLQEALKYYERSLESYKALKSDYAEAILSDNIGLVYSGMKQNEKALAYFFRSLRIQEKIGNKDGYAHCLVNIAGLYKNQGDFKPSLDTYNKALQIAADLNLVNEQLQIHREMSALFEEMGNYQQALNSYKLYQQTNDTLLSVQSREQLSEMQTKLDFKDRENRIILLSKENELANALVQKQQAVMIGVIIISIMAVVLLIIVYRALQFSRKAKLKLEEQNIRITQQHDEIQFKNKQLTDSIQYASRVQDALIVPLENLYGYVNGYFLISKPQNIVSGDFYWYRFVHNHLFIGLADCTGHGVPGAFMGMLGNTLLNEVIGHPTLLSTNEILNQLRLKVKSSLHQVSMDGNSDGMDIALCRINIETLDVEYSGAYQSIFIAENQKVTEIKADKMPVSVSRGEMPFSIQHFNISKGSRIYFSSDGFYDQFGGDRNEKITKSRFKELLEKEYNQPMDIQKQELEDFFDQWKNDREQTDDVMILGIQF